MEKIFCVGDSLIAGFPYDSGSSWIAEVGRLTGLAMINHGVCGECCDEITQRLDSLTALFQNGDGSAHVIFEGGMNDLLDGLSIDGAIDSMRLAKKICDERGAKIAFVMPWLVAASELDAKISRLREAMTRGLAFDGVPLFDFEPIFEGNGDGRARYFTWDGVHPNDTTYRLLGGHAAPLIKKWLGL